MGYSIKEGEYKGHRLFEIWRVDDKGEKVGGIPYLSFGKAKAKVLLEVYPKLKQWVEHHEKVDFEKNKEENINQEGKCVSWATDDLPF